MYPYPNGPFGNMMPYLNFHGMNLDWVIQIAKDFLDQYTHIQDIINQGETDINNLTQESVTLLQNTANTLENLLNQWYQTHSEDIAQELADALAEFNQQADAKATAVIASIPDDYTEVVNEVKAKNRTLLSLTTDVFAKGSLDSQGEDDTFNEDARAKSGTVYMTHGTTIKRSNPSSSAAFTIYFYDNDNRLLNKTNWISCYYIPKGTNVKLLISPDPNSSTSVSLSDILSAFIIDTDTDGICQGSLASGVDDNAWKYYERLRDSYIKYTDKPLAVIGFVGMASISYFNAAGSFLNYSSWSHYQIIPAGSYYRGTYRIDDSVAFAPNKFSDHFFVTDKLNFAQFINEERIVDVVRRGTRSNTDFTNYAAQKRIATVGHWKADKDIFIKYNYGYYNILLYDDQGAVDQYLTWRQMDCFIPKGQAFDFDIDKDINDPTATATIDWLMGAITFIVCEDDYAGNNPNIILQCRNVDEYRYPPYSKYYIRAAYENQYDRVRVNVRVTTDDHFVLIHNNTINAEARNPDGTAIDDPVNSSGQTLAYLNSFDWGIKYGDRYAGMEVPTFEDACKYASYYNLGLTIETTDLGTGTDVIRGHIDQMFKIMAKYGLVENSIIITASGQYFSEMEYWKSLSKYISFFIGGTEQEVEALKSSIDNLITGYNQIYVMTFPFGSVPTDNFIYWCINQGYKMYSSAALTKSELFNTVGFDKGNTLIEANDVYMVKNTIKDYADAQ